MIRIKVRIDKEKILKYNPNFLNTTNILSLNERKSLKDCVISFTEVKGNERLLESQEFEFVYISARTEGNTYTRGEAISLLEKGLTAGGKPFYDAKMLENIKNTFEEYVISPKKITKNLIKDIHFTINDGILEKNRLGVFREEPVSIKGTSYLPPIGRDYINSEIDYILKQYESIEDPFEKSIYIHCNIAYLQPFKDGNKRTARMLQAITLANYDIMPLVSKEEYISTYLDAMLMYYESGDYREYIQYFIKAYKEQYEYLANFNKSETQERPNYPRRCRNK
ncbi:MAG TPA: Fic family protein [Bacteroidia bacterium]|nr:Fic family protein [Bacteroidia bacterium]